MNITENPIVEARHRFGLPRLQRGGSFVAALFVSVSIFHAGTGSCAPAYKGPELSSLPQAVQQTIKDQLGDGKLVCIEESSRNDETLYRVGLKKEGKDRSFTVDDDGKLRRLQVLLDEAPASVQAGIRKHLGSGTLVWVDKVTDEEGVAYEVEMTRDGRDRDFAVDPNGALLRIECFLEETPAPVQKSIRARVGGGRIGEIHKLLKKGENTFKVEMTRHRKSLPFSVDPDGSLASACVLVHETPPPVQQTIRAQVGDGYIDEIELWMDDKGATYDVTFTKADVTKSFTVSAKGKLEHSE
jgi:uncharacterized membrane protein YkoI